MPYWYPIHSVYLKYILRVQKKDFLRWNTFSRYGHIGPILVSLSLIQGIIMINDKIMIWSYFKVYIYKIHIQMFMTQVLTSYEAFTIRIQNFFKTYNCFNMIWICNIIANYPISTSIETWLTFISPNIKKIKKMDGLLVFI